MKHTTTELQILDDIGFLIESLAKAKQSKQYSEVSELRYKIDETIKAWQEVKTIIKRSI